MKIKDIDELIKLIKFIREFGDSEYGISNDLGENVLAIQDKYWDKELIIDPINKTALIRRYGTNKTIKEIPYEDAINTINKKKFMRALMLCVDGALTEYIYAPSRKDRIIRKIINRRYKA